MSTAQICVCRVGIRVSTSCRRQRNNRKTLGARAVAATLILLAFTTLAFALSRQDAPMIALGPLLAATSMEVLRR